MVRGYGTHVCALVPCRVTDNDLFVCVAGLDNAAIVFCKVLCFAVCCAWHGLILPLSPRGTVSWCSVQRASGCPMSHWLFKYIFMSEGVGVY